MRRKADLLEGITKEIKSSRVINNNTLEVRYTDGSIAVRLHNTDIVTTKKNGNIVLNSGGWKTVTTKARINEYSPFYIQQKNSIWRIGDSIFFDGIEFTRSGKCINAKKSRAMNDKQVDKMKKRIKTYVSLLEKKKELPKPSNGDCFYCAFTTDDKQSMGDAFKDTDHLLSHMREKYFPGSMLVNAMREAGYNDMQIGTHYGMDWKGAFIRSLKKYLHKRLLK